MSTGEGVHQIHSMALQWYRMWTTSPGLHVGPARAHGPLSLLKGALRHKVLTISYPGFGLDGRAAGGGARRSNQRRLFEFCGSAGRAPCSIGSSHTISEMQG